MDPGFSQNLQAQAQAHVDKLARILLLESGHVCLPHSVGYLK